MNKAVLSALDVSTWFSFLGFLANNFNRLRHSHITRSTIHSYHSLNKFISMRSLVSNQQQQPFSYHAHEYWIFFVVTIIRAGMAYNPKLQLLSPVRLAIAPIATKIITPKRSRKMKVIRPKTEWYKIWNNSHSWKSHFSLQVNCISLNGLDSWVPATYVLSYRAKAGTLCSYL